MRTRPLRSLRALALLAGLALTTAAAAQPAPTPSPGPVPRSNADAPAPRPEPRGGDTTYTFQLVLLVADTKGDQEFENVPANAQKALRDVKGFLPYTSYRLLDLAWLRSSRTAEAQVSGPDGRSLSAAIRFHSDASRIEIERLVIVEAPRPPMLLEAPRKDGAPTAIAPITPQPVRPLLETSFGMKAGETVVVGTAKLDGPSKALVVLLSAIP